MQQVFFTLFFLAGLVLTSCAQSPASPPLSAFSDPLYKSHPQYKEADRKSVV